MLLSPQWTSLVANRIVAASTTPPTTQGLVGVMESLTGFGIFAFLTLKITPPSDDTAIVMFPTTNRQQEHPPLSTIVCTFGRVLIIPSLMEELVWRVALLPHPIMVVVDDNIIDANAFLFFLQIVGVNVCFSLHHIVGGAHVLSRLGHRPGALHVFPQPLFLLLAFCIGYCICTVSYYIAGASLYAPVLVHAVVVTVWLLYFGGNTLLSESTTTRQS